MPWGQIMIASAVLLSGAGFGTFILLRLRAEPVEDKDSMERVSSIEAGLGFGKPPDQHRALPPAVQNAAAQALLPRAIALTGPAL